jgi:hypothetical protein
LPTSPENLLSPTLQKNNGPQARAVAEIDMDARASGYTLNGP